MQEEDHRHFFVPLSMGDKQSGPGRNVPRIVFVNSGPGVGHPLHFWLTVQTPDSVKLTPGITGQGHGLCCQASILNSQVTTEIGQYKGGLDGV
jgi:hypothetical protein